MTRIDRNRLGVVPWIGFALALAGLAAVAWLWSADRHDAAALRAWQAATLQQLGRAASMPPPAPADAADVIARLAHARDAALAIAAAPVQPGTDAASSDDPRAAISRLRATQSTGTAAGDAQIIEQDSRAAWTGWQ